MSRVSSTVTRRARLAVVAAAGCATLVGVASGCGVSEGGFRPGAAAVVGDDTVSVQDVDSAAEALCGLIDEAGQGAQSGSQVRATMLEGLVLRAVAEQINQDYDVPVGQLYEQSVSGAEDELSDLDSDELEAVLPGVTGTAYFVDVMTAIGREELGIDSTDDYEGQEGLPEGIKIAQQWTEDNPIRTSPAFPELSIGESQVDRERIDLSVAVSDFAKAATADEVDPAFVDALPESQRCG